MSTSPVFDCHMAKLSPGNLVRTRRETLGLTRVQLALKADTSISTIDRLELQDHIPNALTLASIAGALDITVDEILAVAA